MKQRKATALGFIIDKLTNSIENTFTGDSFQTDITRLTQSDLKTVTKKSGWNFDWKRELSENDRDVYKLTIVNNPTVIQGLLSFTIKSDHVYMHLLESALLILAKTKFIMEFRVIWLLLPVKFHFSMVGKGSFLLSQKRN